MTSPVLICQSCGADYPVDERYNCRACGGELDVAYDLKSTELRRAFTSTWMHRGNMWEAFSPLLPQTSLHHVITLGEGGTPLVKSHRLAAELGIRDLYFKLELANPTGSFKDRQISVAISKANEQGNRRFGTVSSGNVGVALSAYCAKAGLTAYVWVSEEVAASKREQIQVYGAQVFLLPRPNAEDARAYLAAFTSMQAFCLKNGLVPMVSARPVNPYIVEGGKTVSFEIAAALGRAPDAVYLPVGGGGLLGGMWKGFAELKTLGLVDQMPELHGAQRGGYFAPIDKLETEPYATGPYYRPLDGPWAWASLQASRGTLRTITTEDITSAQVALATLEGIFAEPQGVYSLAGLIKAAKEDDIRNDALAVCVITGAGLKDATALTSIIHAGHVPAYQRVESIFESEDRIREAT